MQSGWVEEVTVVIVLEVARVEVLMVVYRQCHQLCQQLVWWCGGWAGEEVQLT